MSTSPAEVQSSGFARAQRALLACLPRFSAEEQSLALTLHRLLAEGEPVARERLARTLDRPTPDVVRLLDGECLRGLVVYGARRAVVGFGGLAVVPMHHRLLVGGRTLYTWCAWDALFLPELLGVTAEVRSACPETGETIRLAVRPRSIHSLSAPGTVVSFLVPDRATFLDRSATTIADFCHFVFFFPSRAVGERWTGRHEGTFLLTLEEAFALGRRKNALQFPTAGAP